MIAGAAAAGARGLASPAWVRALTACHRRIGLVGSRAARSCRVVAAGGLHASQGTLTIGLTGLDVRAEDLAVRGKEEGEGTRSARAPVAIASRDEGHRKSPCRIGLGQPNSRPRHGSCGGKLLTSGSARAPPRLREQRGPSAAIAVARRPPLPTPRKLGGPAEQVSQDLVSASGSPRARVERAIAEQRCWTALVNRSSTSTGLAARMRLAASATPDGLVLARACGCRCAARRRASSAAANPTRLRRRRLGPAHGVLAALSVGVGVAHSGSTGCRKLAKAGIGRCARRRQGRS